MAHPIRARQNYDCCTGLFFSCMENQDGFMCGPCLPQKAMMAFGLSIAIYPSTGKTTIKLYIYVYCILYLYIYNTYIYTYNMVPASNPVELHETLL
jgi:hypothetical protein